MISTEEAPLGLDSVGDIVVWHNNGIYKWGPGSGWVGCYETKEAALRHRNSDDYWYYGDVEAYLIEDLCKKAKDKGLLGVAVKDITGKVVLRVSV